MKLHAELGDQRSKEARVPRVAVRRACAAKAKVLSAGEENWIGLSTPSAVRSPLWEPGELRLVRSKSVLRPESDEPDEEDSTCKVTKIQTEGEGQWNDDEGMKYSSAQRLRLHLAAQLGVKELKFRYYFEEFGNIKLP